MNSIITIGRESGSAGHRIGKLLAREFGVVTVNTGVQGALEEKMKELGMVEGFDVGMEMSGNRFALNQLINSMVNALDIEALLARVKIAKGAFCPVTAL